MSAKWIFALVVLWIFVVFLALLVLGLVRRVTVVLERAEARLRLATASAADQGIAPGSPVPRFTARDGMGMAVTSSSLEGAPTLLLFLSTHCPPCEMLAEQLRSALKSRAESGVTVIIDESPEARELAEGLGARVLYQRDHEVSKEFATSTTPHAFAIDASGLVVDSGIPSSLADLEYLEQRAIEGGEETQQRREKVTV